MVVAKVNDSVGVEYADRRIVWLLELPWGRCAGVGMVDHFIPVWLRGREGSRWQCGWTRLESGQRAGLLRHGVDDRACAEVIGLGRALENHRVVYLLILLGSLKYVLTSYVVIIFGRVSHWRCVY